MGWSVISKAEHLLRHDPEWEQVTEKMALHRSIKEKAREQSVGVNSRILTVLRDQQLKF